MSNLYSNEGYFRCGIPYNRFGNGSSILVIFQGLLFVNKPMPGFMAKKFFEMYNSIAEKYTIYIVNRKPGLPKGYSLQNMADDYAKMIREEFGCPVDVLGISTGGSIVQHFAADHPDLVNKLIIHSSAYTLRDSAKKGQMYVGQLASERKWRAAYAEMMGISLPKGSSRYLIQPFYWFISLFGKSFFGMPDDPSEISAPTLVIAGDKDPFYSEKLFSETAKSIPNARLIIYKGMGHPASGKQFKRDLRNFLIDS